MVTVVTVVIMVIAVVTVVLTVFTVNTVFIAVVITVVITVVTVKTVFMIEMLYYSQISFYRVLKLKSLLTNCSNYLQQGKVAYPHSVAGTKVPVKEITASVPNR